MKPKIVVKTFRGCVEEILADGEKQEFTEEEVNSLLTKTGTLREERYAKIKKNVVKCSCGKETEHLNEGTLCDECYAKYEKTFKVKLKWEKEMDLGEFKGFTDEEIREQAQDKLDQSEDLKETTIYSEWELVNVETGTKISMGAPD